MYACPKREEKTRCVMIGKKPNRLDIVMSNTEPIGGGRRSP